MYGRERGVNALSLRCVTSSDFNWKKAGSLSESLNISTTGADPGEGPGGAVPPYF